MIRLYHFQFTIARLACLPCKKNDRQVHKRYIAVAQFHCSRDPSSTARCKAKLLIWERTSLKSNPHINDHCLTFLPWGSADVSPKRNGDPSPHFPQEEVDVAPPPENPPRHRPSSSWLDLLLSPPLPGHGESQWLLACEPPSHHHHNQHNHHQHHHPNQRRLPMELSPAHHPQLPITPLPPKRWEKAKQVLL